MLLEKNINIKSSKMIEIIDWKIKNIIGNHR